MGQDRSILHPPHLQDAKEASQMLVSAFGGQVAVAALFERSRHQRYSDVGLKNTPDFLTIAEVDALEARTQGMPGWPQVTNWLCRRRGGVFVILPRADSEDDAAQCIIEMMSELGDVSREITTSLADREISAREAKRILDQLDDVDRVSSRLRTLLMARAYPDHAQRSGGGD